MARRGFRLTSEQPPSTGGSWGGADWPHGQQFSERSTSMGVGAGLEPVHRTAESAFLEVKSCLYQLDDPGSSAKLIKDVAAFANRHGGLILIGFATRVEGGHEIIDELKPVPVSLVDTDRHRKLVRERVHPHIRDLTVEFYSVDDERGVLVIDIPPQPDAAKPFVVPGLDGKRAPTAVGVPIRDADATQWLTRSDLQRLLSAGWTPRTVPEPTSSRPCTTPSPQQRPRRESRRLRPWAKERVASDGTS